MARACLMRDRPVNPVRPARPFNSGPNHEKAMRDTQSGAVRLAASCPAALSIRVPAPRTKCDKLQELHNGRGPKRFQLGCNRRIGVVDLLKGNKKSRILPDTNTCKCRCGVVIMVETLRLR